MMLKKPMRWRPISAACLLAALLSGCAAGAADSFCRLALPVYISAEDILSDATARQVLQHNEVYKELCGNF